MKTEGNFFIISGQKLSPGDKETQERMRSFKPGSLVHVEITGEHQEASLRQYGFYFTLCRLVAENTEDTEWNTKSKVDTRVRLLAGWANTYMVMGDLYSFPKSLKQKEISAVEFNAFFDQAISIMAEKLKITQEELVNFGRNNS